MIAHTHMAHAWIHKMLKIWCILSVLILEDILIICIQSMDDIWMCSFMNNSIGPIKNSSGPMCDTNIYIYNYKYSVMCLCSWHTSTFMHIYKNILYFTYVIYSHKSYICIYIYTHIHAFYHHKYLYKHMYIISICI